MKKSARPVGESGGGRASSVGGFRLSLDIAAADGGEPLFLRIARALIADIRRGRLGRGTRLPGSRALAESLCVHRNTVLAAYRELLAEGWIASQAGRGTFVSRELREADVPARVGRAKTRPARRSPDRIGFAFDGPAELAPYRAPKRGLLRMLGGVPDLRLVPNEAFARAARRVLRRSSEILGYGDPAGHPRLRSALADMLRSTRGLVAASDDILITRGSQMALSLVARALIRPGDIVAVEAFGYPPAFAALEQAGARLVPIAVDGQGLKVPLLAALVARERVRALYLTPHHQYPTTVQLSPARRLELLALAARERFAVIEDDYDHEFHYEGRPVLPLASSDDAGVVLYIGTLSKVFAPGIRIGYVIAPRSMLAALTRQRFYLDRQGDQVTECALAELIEDGELARHTRRTRRIYQARRDHCAALLAQQLGSAVRFQRPNGGMALWARIDRSIGGERLAECAEREGVLIQAGRQFRLDRSETPFIRLGYAALDDVELVEAVRRLKRAFHEARR